MDIEAVVNLLLRTRSYPVELAKRVGYEKAVIVYELINSFGFSYIDDSIFDKKITDFAFSKNIKESLISDGLVEVDSLRSRVAVSYFDDPFDFVKPTPFQDKNVRLFIDKYKAMALRKGRKKTDSDIEAFYKGYTAEEIVESLKYSIDNSFITLYDNRNRGEKNSRFSKGNRTDSGVFSSGGSQNAGTREGIEGEGRSSERRSISLEDL